VAEVLLQFSDPVVADGEAYIARACGTPADDGLWQGWIEFTSIGDGSVIRSGRETTQPNHGDALYWATGLTAVYLEGALQRALRPQVQRPVPPPSRPAFDGPEPKSRDEPRRTESILDPFSVYRKGEAVLRRQLGALSEWHLVNIIRANGLSTLDPGELNAMPAPALIAVIVDGVRQVATRG